MADTVCTVCGEPWDVHHINHDMPLWKHLLFRAGKGCESCEGVPPEGGVDIERVGSILLNGGDDVDPMPAAMRLGDDPKDFSKEWEAPPARVLAKCEGCGETAEIEEDDIYPYRKDGKQIGHIVIWTKRPNRGFFDIGQRHDVPLDEFGIDKKWPLDKYDEGWDFDVHFGKTLCNDCVDKCDNCNEVIYIGEAQEKFCRDTYNEGNSHYCAETNQTLCTGCLERSEQCEGCSEILIPDEGEKSKLTNNRCEDCQPVEKFTCACCGDEHEMDEYHDGLFKGALCGSCHDDWTKMVDVGKPHLLRVGQPTTECGLPREEVDFWDFVESVKDAEIRCWECHKVICNAGEETHEGREENAAGSSNN